MTFNWNMTFHEEHVSLSMHTFLRTTTQQLVITTYINHITIVITVYQFLNWVTIFFWCVWRSLLKKKLWIQTPKSSLHCQRVHIHTHNHGTQTIDRPVPIIIPRHTRGEICCPWCQNFLQWQKVMSCLRRFSYDIRAIIVPVFLHNPCSACSNHHTANNTNCPAWHFLPVKKKP